MGEDEEGDMSSFNEVQKLPISKRPRALHNLLRDLTGDQILVYLKDAARVQQQEVRRGGESAGLISAVVRCAPVLPGFRDVSLTELLLHPVDNHLESGFDCPLGVLLIKSPSADEAVAAFFRRSGMTLCKLFEWALRSPSSPALLECLCESVSRLDRAQLDVGVAAPKDSLCVVDAWVEVCCKPSWTMLEATLLSSSLAKLRDASMRELEMCHDVSTARGLLVQATQRPSYTQNKRTIHDAEGTDASGRDDCHCRHLHLVKGIVQGLVGEWKSDSRRTLFLQDVVDGMSCMTQISAALDLVQSARDESTGGMDASCAGAGSRAQSGQASVRLFARAANLMLGSEAAAEVPGSGNEAADGGCFPLRCKSLQSVDAALDHLVSTAISDGYLGMRALHVKAQAKCTGVEKPHAIPALRDAVGFMQASAAIGLLLSNGGCMAGDSPSSHTHAIRSIRRAVGMSEGAKEKGKWCCAEGVGLPVKATDLTGGVTASLAMEIADLKALGAVLLFILSLREQEDPLPNGSSCASQSASAASQGSCDAWEQASTDAKCKARILKFVLVLLSADAERIERDSPAGGGGRLVGGSHKHQGMTSNDDFTEQDLEEALQVLVRIAPSMSCRDEAGLAKAQELPQIGAANGEDAVKLLREGILVCLIKGFHLRPSFLAPASFRSLGNFVLGYISSVLPEEGATARKCGSRQAGTCRHDEKSIATRGTRVSAEELARALVAMNCLIAAQVVHTSLPLDAAARADHPLSEAHHVAPSIPEVCRVYCRLALWLSEEVEPCGRVSGGSCRSDEGESTNLSGLEKECGGMLGDSRPSATWRHTLFCRGVGGVGLLLAVVFKGVEKFRRGAWLAAALGETKDNWTRDPRFLDLSLPASVLSNAKEEMHDECGGRMLRMFAAVCRCAALAGARSVAIVFKDIVQRGSSDGEGTFMRGYNQAACSTTVLGTVPFESVRDDRQRMWQALFSCARQVDPGSAGASCLTPLLAAIAGAIKTGDTEDKLAPLLQARALRVLLEGARSQTQKTRFNAMMGMAELVGVGGTCPGIAQQPALWAMLENQVIGPSSSPEQAPDGLQQVLAACRAQPDDQMETVWCGFIFVMVLLMEDRCPRIYTLIADRSGRDQGAPSLAIRELQASVAENIHSWALRLRKNGGTDLRQDICESKSDCYLLISSLLRISQTEHVAEQLARRGTFGALWEIFDAQPLEWLQGGGGCGAGEGECVMFQFLACLLQSRASISNFVSHVGGLQPALQRIQRYAVQSSSTGGNHWLNRERRDRLCAFQERLQQARWAAGPSKPA